MAVYGYIRVSTDKQTVENQRFEINNFAEKEGILIERWVEETISGTKDAEKRQLGKLLKKLKKDDVLICAELSRLGRSLLMIMNILHHCMKNEVQVWTIKDNFRLGKDIQSQVLAFAFGLSAQIERDLISMRTKEALARKKAEGVILGRPIGAKSTRTKLTGQEKKIYDLLKKDVSYSAIGRILGVHRLTVSKFVKEKMNEDGTLKKLPEEQKVNIQVKSLEPFTDDIKRLHKDKVPMYQIAKEYGTTPGIISNFLRLNSALQN